MSNSCLKITRIWSDESLIELSVNANGIDIKAAIEVYTSSDEVKYISKEMINFPSNNNHVIKWEFGSKDERSYSYLLLKVYLIDRQGHAVIEYEMDNMAKLPNTRKAHFCIPTEIASINELGRRMGALLDDDGVSIEGIYFYT
jgi:hypothetical protein